MKSKTALLLKPFPFRSRSDRLFAAQMCETIPRVREGFARFSKVDPADWLRESVVAVHQQIRSGYHRRGIPLEEVQTVAEHMASGQQVAFLIAADPEYVSKMFAVHDLAEGWMGDFTPVDPITKPEKYRLEQIIMRLLVSAHSVPSERKEILGLWEEFEEQSTPASHSGNDIDRDEMMMQVQVYEPRYPDLKHAFVNMWVESPSRLKTSQGQKLFAELLENQPNIHPLKQSRAPAYVFPWNLS